MRLGRLPNYIFRFLPFDHTKRFLEKLLKLRDLADKDLGNLDKLQMNLGRLLTIENNSKPILDLKQCEFSIFSQWGEDGILQYLTECLHFPNKTFVEFGVGNFSESNCRFLMMKDNWSGLVIEASSSAVENLRNSSSFWRYDLTVICDWITRDNIVELIGRWKFKDQIDIISIDVDGIDFFILEKILTFRPRLIVCEYNAIFGPSRTVSVPYSENFSRFDEHFSGLFYGASLASLTNLAMTGDYSLIGTNSAGNNAFFLRNDMLTSAICQLDSVTAFTPSKFRESRKEDSSLSYLTSSESAESLKGLFVLNTSTGELEPF